MHKDTTVQNQRSVRLPSFLDVASWEARRSWASPSTRRIIVIAFGLFLLIAWSAHYPVMIGFGIGNTSYTFHVSGGSAWGVVAMLFPFSILLAILLPFLNTGGVAHDVKSRTHELLMATPVSARAYILGRYLFYLLASLGLALLLLVTLYLANLLFHLTEAGYPLPQVNVLLVFWLVAIFPIAILLSSVSFALGTLLPRHTNLATMLPVIAWVLFVMALLYLPPSVTSSTTGGSSSNHTPTPDKPAPFAWYQLWDPTNIGMETGLFLFYRNEWDITLNSFPSGNDQPPIQHIFADLHELEQYMPDMLPWLLPHLVWASIGVLLVLSRASSFNRFRTLLN